MDWDTDVAPAIIAGAMARADLVDLALNGGDSAKLAHVAMELNASTETIMKRLDELEFSERELRRLAEYVAQNYTEEIPVWQEGTPGEYMVDIVIRLLP